MSSAGNEVAVFTRRHKNNKDHTFVHLLMLTGILILTFTGQSPDSIIEAEPKHEFKLSETPLRVDIFQYIQCSVAITCFAKLPW
jgi:hypothetical protein